LSLTAFYIENISLPPEVEQALDKRTQMGVLSNLDQYTKYQTANAIGDAAKNPGGVGGVGAQLAAGMAIGQQMAGNIGTAMQAPAQTTSPGGAAVPPPLPSAVSFYIELDGQQAGPLDVATLSERARKGLFTRQTLVWKQGMASWAAAETVPELQGVFAAVPPPLPPRQ